MYRQKLSGMKENFLQRRYAVRLGRRYVLAAAGVVLLSVLGCSQVNDNSNNILTDSRILPSELPGQKNSNP